MIKIEYMNEEDEFCGFKMPSSLPACPRRGEYILGKKGKAYHSFLVDRVEHASGRVIVEIVYTKF